MTLRSVGSSGGQAAAFTYDLARSVVYTRQGNPAWAGQERDGVVGIRPDDLFYGARAGDVQPDWVDTNKIAIPQADEQQRLLVNLITLMERDKLPLPRFWYLPRGEKAVVVHERRRPLAEPGARRHGEPLRPLQGAEPGRLRRRQLGLRPLDAPTSIPSATLTNAQAAGYLADGFEVGAAPARLGSCPTTSITEAELGALFDTQLAAVPGEVHERPGAGLEPHALRLLARLGLEREGRARARDPDGRATTTTTPAPGSAPSRAS